MDQILEHCPGCIGIADDITVHGKTEEEHDRNLRNLMVVARANGLVFNPQKTHVKAKSVNFFGNVYDEFGVHPDPGKIKAIKTMEPPKNARQLMEFLGMVQYQGVFTP